jgi:predicted ATPase
METATTQAVETPRGPPITYLSVHQFRQFEQLSLHNLIWTNVIMGANGSGKTSVLWAIIVVLRSFNLCVKGSKWGEQTKVVIEGMDFSRLINAPHFQSASWTRGHFVCLLATGGRSLTNNEP